MTAPVLTPEEIATLRELQEQAENGADAGPFVDELHAYAPALLAAAEALAELRAAYGRGQLRVIGPHVPPLLYRILGTEE